MPTGEILIQRFRELHLAYGRAHNSHKDGFREANIELFILAQAIGALYAPGVQQSLNETRRAIVKDLLTGPQRLTMIDAVMAPVGKRKVNYVWSDYQITPEISVDPELLGRVVSHKLTRKLLKTQRLQISLVLRACLL